MARPWILLALAALAVLAACGRSPDEGTEPAEPAEVPGTAEVLEVIDGDTIDVRIGGRVERVRLLGIDTPETVDPDRPVECHGPEASAFTHQLLPAGTRVLLQRDEEARDHFGRLLAYVFLADDGTFVNEAILAAGEAELLTIEPNDAYRDRLGAAAGAARSAGDGLWGGCPPGTG